MDPRHQNHENGNNQDNQSMTGNYGYNFAPNDSFNSFLQPDQEPSFNAPWDTEAFSNPHEPINGFSQGNHGWHQNPIQPSNLLPVSSHGVHSRPFDQTYSRSPASFNYSGFQSHPGHTLATPSYDTSLGYGHLPLNEESQFDYSRPQPFQRTSNQSQTISPQALQNYPTSFTQDAQHQRQPQQSNLDPALTLRGPPTKGTLPPQVTRQEWNSVVAAVPKGDIQGDFLVKAPAEFSSRTNSKHLIGYTFVGANSLELATTKATIPKYTKRSSRNEIRRLLLQEKGTGPWDAAREPLVKKLKLSGSRSSGTRNITPLAGLRHQSLAGSESSAEPTSESEPEEDSDYDSGSEEEVEPEEVSPLPAIRPNDPSKATEYDIIKAVWAKRSVALSSTIIRTALGEYWAILKAVRDKWKLEMTALAQAEEKKNHTRVIEHERRALNQRRLLESCVRLTLKYGHRDIVEKLGENPTVSLICYQFILDRFKSSEYTGPFIASMLELLTRCITIDQAILEKTKLDKVLPRIVKRGDDQGKLLAQKVLDSAEAATKKKAADGTPPQPQEFKGTAMIRPSTNSSRSSDAVSGTKRTRVDEASGIQSLKKQATSAIQPGQAITTIAKGSGTLGSKHQPVKVDGKVVPKATASAVPAPKVKTNHVIAKPSAFFSSLQSASKKPGTSNAALQSTKSKDAKPTNLSEHKTTATEGSAAAAKPSLIFAETMANLSKPKEATPSKFEEARPPESLEEKKKRLRKEERRKLRVSFKPDHSLVSIREFVHDPEEEMGHEDSMVRDVGDSRGEGQMLKMHKDLDVMDEDEDSSPAEETLAPWYSPSLVDFSVVASEELERNYTTRGGKVEIQSREREVQEQRELTTLMVIYTISSDIPPSPREPSDPYSGEPATEQTFGMPNDETKSREAQFYAAQSHQYRSSNTSTIVAKPQAQQPVPPVPDIAALLKIINGQQQPQPQAAQQQPQQQPLAQPQSVGLEAIFAQFANNNNQGPQMQMPQQPSTSGFDLQATLAAMTQRGQAPQGYGVPPPPPQGVDLQSILAQFGQAPTQTQGYGYQSIYQGENDRKRQADYDDPNGDYGYNKGKRQKSVPEKKKFYGVPRLPCKFWQEGKCRKGDECTFLHD